MRFKLGVILMSCFILSFCMSKNVHASVASAITPKAKFVDLLKKTMTDAIGPSDSQIFNNLYPVTVEQIVIPLTAIAVSFWNISSAESLNGSSEIPFSVNQFNTILEGMGIFEAGAYTNASTLGEFQASVRVGLEKAMQVAFEGILEKYQLHIPFDASTVRAIDKEMSDVYFFIFCIMCKTQHYIYARTIAEKSIEPQEAFSIYSSLLRMMSSFTETKNLAENSPLRKFLERIEQGTRYLSDLSQEKINLTLSIIAMDLAYIKSKMSSSEQAANEKELGEAVVQISQLASSFGVISSEEINFMTNFPIRWVERICAGMQLDPMEGVEKF